MQIVSQRLEMDEKTYHPQYRIELLLPIEQLMDKVSYQTEQEIALDFYKTFKEQFEKSR